MYIKLLFSFTAFLIAIAQIAFAEENHPQIFHAMKVETDIGTSHNGAVSTWDIDGWIGGDVNKLWIKSQGESLKGRTPEFSEYWAMYSRNIATFWDGQIGIRYDEQPNSTAYFAAGVEGLAPYLFETKAHLFVSDKGDITARLGQENDLLITQRLITQPYFEINVSAHDIPEQQIGTGFTSGEFGIQTRYEITRKFAPYVDLRYERKLGETATIAKKHGEDQDNTIASIGLRLIF